MGDFINIQIDGSDRILKKFRDIDIYLNRGLDKPLDDTGKLLLKKFDQNFDTEGRTLKKKWKKLNSKTLAQKARLGFASKGILERTSKMRRGFEKKVKRFSVRVFNDVNYFRYPQLGEGNNPKRIMIRTTNNINQDIVQIFRVGLAKILRR